jgi:hypothetical protein
MAVESQSLDAELDVDVELDVDSSINLAEE